jgi:uncharacterized Fe-S cluster protein YjdI
MRSVTKKYSNGEVTVVWKSGLCKHATYCYRALPKVFDPSRHPWIDPAAAPTERIIAQVKRCPSGALSYFLNNEEPLNTGDGTGLAQTTDDSSPVRLSEGEKTVG